MTETEVMNLQQVNTVNADTAELKSKITPGGFMQTKRFIGAIINNSTFGLKTTRHPYSVSFVLIFVIFPIIPNYWLA